MGVRASAHRGRGLTLIPLIGRVLSGRLLRRGVRVFEEPQAMMQAMRAAFDGGLAVVRTSNLDRQRRWHSCEVNAVFAGHEVPDWIRAHFGPERPGLHAPGARLLGGRGWTRALGDRWAEF